PRPAESAVPPDRALPPEPAPAPPGSAPSAEVAKASPSGGFAETSRASQARRYFSLGVRHILPMGWDHVLFVSGLVLGSALRLRSLLLQLTAFTVAHTLTLALGALGIVVLPKSIVEPFIAFSIAYIAIENLIPELGRVDLLSAPPSMGEVGWTRRL